MACSLRPDVCRHDSGIDWSRFLPARSFDSPSDRLDTGAMALLRSIATVGGFTLASRVLGLARDMLLAHALGAGPVADAFLVAFRLPNLFRRLFAEGAFNAAFVPLFARKLTEEGRES